jgi:hypothetical protein
MSDRVKSHALPGAVTEIAIRLGTSPGVARTVETFSGRIDVIKPYWSQKPLQGPNRTRPLRQLTNAELKRIAAAHPPPAEWFEGEEECPF